MPYEFDPGGSETDEVRFLVGDTNPDQPLFADDEVDYLLLTWGTPMAAAYQGALALVAKFSAKADIAVGTARKSYTAQAESMRKVAESLAIRGGNIGTPSPTDAQRVGAPVAFGKAGDVRDDGSVITMWSDKDWAVDSESDDFLGEQ